MIVAADIFEFLTVFIPVTFLAQLAFRIGPALGRSRIGTAFFIGDSVIGFSYMLKIYFDSVLGRIYDFWLFVFTLSACLGLILALVGASSILSFLVSGRSGDTRTISKAAKICFIVATFFLIGFLPYLITFDRPVYWRFGILCYIVSQAVLFGLGTLLGEFFHTVDKPSASGLAKFARILAAYYLVEPVVWFTLSRISSGGHPPEVVRLSINVVGFAVSFLFAAMILRFMRLYLPTVMRQVKTTYLDTLRVRVLRDLYIAGAGLVVFVFVILLMAESLYENLRTSTLESLASQTLSADRLAVAKTSSALESIASRLQRLGESVNPGSSLTSFRNDHDFIDAVGSADEKKEVTFLSSENSILMNPQALDLLKATMDLLEKSSADMTDCPSFIRLPGPRLAPEVLMVTKTHNVGTNRRYAFALVNIREILWNNVSDLKWSEADLRLVSADSKVVVSSRGNEIGQDFQDAILWDKRIDSKDLEEELRSLSLTQYDGYGILRGQNSSGEGEYYILVSVPLDFHELRGRLISIEQEEKVSRLFQSTNSLLLLAGLLVVGLFGSGIIVMSVAFRWAMKLEKEVQSKIQELRSSEDRYRRIVENPYIGSFIMVDNRLIFSNARLAEIFETDLERLSGSDLSAFVDTKDYTVLKDIFESIIRGEKFGDRWRVNGTTASGRHVSLSGYASIINIGSKRGVQSLVVDSTSENQEKEKLEQFEKLESMATLAAGIAHDFNNILQVVLGSSRLLQRQLQTTELKRHADNIAKVALRGSDLSKRLLTFSQHKGMEQKGVFNINEIIMESLPLFRETFPRTIKIETQLSSTPIYVGGDQSQIQQVIFNLAVNARDAMPHGGTLAVKTEILEVAPAEAEAYQGSPGTYASVTIADTGEGIRAESMPKIFEPFFTTKAPGKGTGLGLSVVYGIVRSHNGFLKVHSEVKKGTVFDIYLPLSPSDGGVQVEPPHDRVNEPVGTYDTDKSAALRNRKILFVDDEDGIREAGKFVLESAGCTVITAKDGMSALEIYRKDWKEISLVVLDLNMPELSGREVLENFTIIDPDVRVLISTGYITPEEKAGLKGIVEIIEKPFDFEDLVEKVKTLLLDASENDHCNDV